MTFIRDFRRKRRLAAHVRKYGWKFEYHGHDFTLPTDVHVGVANALIRGRYESEEIALIREYLAPDRPVLELGGSYGVTAGIIGAKLDPKQRHLIVEANPKLLETCLTNARCTSPDRDVEVLNYAVDYGGPVAQLKIGVSPHSSHIATDNDHDGTISVPAITLSELHQRLGSPSGYAFISDIEGGEVEIFVNDAEIIAMADLVIMELHPGVAKPGDPDIPAIMQSLGFTLKAQIGDAWAWKK